MCTRLQTLFFDLQMPIIRAFFLSLLFVGIDGLGAAQAQDSAPHEPVQPISDSASAPARDGIPGESSPSSEEEKASTDPSAPLSLYSPDVLADMPYVYPLLRMRLTPEMRQDAP